MPVNGYSVQAAYIITGETRTGVGVIDPLRRFDLRPGRFGLGAWEPTARFSDVSLGRQVFTGGLADPNLWTNQAYLIDAGVNWYFNKFVKVYFDWEYAIFGHPVYYGPGHFSKTNRLVLAPTPGLVLMACCGRSIVGRSRQHVAQFTGGSEAPSSAHRATHT